MISEKDVATQFNGLWDDVLPLLTPSFVRLFNAANSDDLTEHAQSKFSKISIGPNVEKHDLVAEFSFHIAKISVERNISVGAFDVNSDHFMNAYRAAISFLSKYASDNDRISLNPDEVSEALSLATQYDYFYSHIKPTMIEFSPRIAGAGYLGACNADLSLDDTLYEIKTVSRNIAGKDIKQLILYLALQYSTGTRRWPHAGFFNPRKALHYKFSVDHLIYRTSGGRSTTEVFADIVDFLSARGVEIDAIF